MTKPCDGGSIDSLRLESKLGSVWFEKSKRIRHLGKDATKKKHENQQGRVKLKLVNR